MNIKYYIILILLVVLTGASACKKKTDDNMEAESLRLKTLMTEIKAFSDQEKCEDEADWRFIAIGSKACGGPTAYIAYSSKIDTTTFIQKVNNYTEAQKNFNKKWRISSDCSLVMRPQKVICEDEKPKLIYSTTFIGQL